VLDPVPGLAHDLLEPVQLVRLLADDVLDTVLTRVFRQWMHGECVM